jgi:alpha-L-rhamnosidase
VSRITRRSFVGLAGLGIGGLALRPAWARMQSAAGLSDGFASLYRQFQDPERQYSIRPFWFWNGKLEGAELRRQMKQMVDHGVYGAYAHNRSGLQTPYLSEEWWTMLGEALQAAHEIGFSLCMVDEFEWPSGEARDYWLPGPNKSRVVEADPTFQMQRLLPQETQVQGPRQVHVPLRNGTVLASVGQLVSERRLDGDSLQTLAFDAGAKEISWEAPAGDWIVFTYNIEYTVGRPDHGRVDLMNRAAVAEYIKIYYEEFHRRYGKHLGATMPATFADHEGTYGARLPWTPGLLEAFQRNAGYSLAPYLPALTYDIGARTEKVRCDLLDTVSQLYSENFFQQVTDWCRQHGIDHSGHVWEESLFFGPAHQGDFFRILRSMSNPGCDTLLEWGRQSVWLKENASVADFERRHVVCENQGVQGADSYLSPERIRRVSNCLGAWNVGEFIPHAFNYDLSRTNYPPDWFRAQPYLPWFRSYADQMRRISFMNRDSHHVADIVLYYPQVSIWGQSAPAFSTVPGELIGNHSWSIDATDTNEQYAELKLRLSDERLDYQVTDDYYLGQSAIDGNRLRIAESRFQVLILPPMSTMRRASAEHVKGFFLAGGTVIALRRLPTTSTESGREDEALIRIWSDTFDTAPGRGPYRLRTNPSGGRAYFIPESVPDLLVALHEVLDPDVTVCEGPAEHVFVLHKIKSGQSFYWVVNDTPQSRTNVLAFRTTGRPERWDAHTAERSPLFYQTLKDKTLVRITLNPWDAAYIVFDALGPEQPLALKSTNLDDFYVVNAADREVTIHAKSLIPAQGLSIVLAQDNHEFIGRYHASGTEPLAISGAWNVTLDAAKISLPYAQVLDDPRDQGLHAEWYAQSNDRQSWQPLWLSPMTASLRQWNVIGPFPNPADSALEQHYPPEKAIDLNAVYRGESGAPLRWQQLDAADSSTIAVGDTWGIGTMEVRGGPYGEDNYIVRYGTTLSLGSQYGTAYAQTNVYCPERVDAVLVFATQNPRAVFVNGTVVYSRWLRPAYNPMTDGFSIFIPIRLEAGWNNLLLKFLHNPENAQPARFVCRIQAPDGSVVEGLFSSLRTFNVSNEAAQPAYRWLRFAVPPVAAALKVPPMRYPWLAFIDGNKVSSNTELALPQGAKQVILRVAEKEPLTSPFALTTISASLPLGSWNIPGLEHFSGQMTYQKTVVVPANLLSEHLLLDCGEVGVVAEAWINDQPVGSRAWAPYAFDLSQHVNAGPNHLRVRVANTDANSRAVAGSVSILAKIDLNGWHGPARLVPYLNKEIHLSRSG